MSLRSRSVPARAPIMNETSLAALRVERDKAEHEVRYCLSRAQTLQWDLEANERTLEDATDRLTDLEETIQHATRPPASNGRHLRLVGRTEAA